MPNIVWPRLPHVSATPLSKRKHIMKKFLIGLSLAFSLSTQAAPKAITFSLSKSLGSGYKILAIDTTGKSSIKAISGKRGSIVPSGTKAKLYLLNNKNKVAFQIVSKYCTKATSGSNKGQYVVCTRKNIVNTEIKAGASLGLLTNVKGKALVASLSGTKYLSSVVATTGASASNYVPVGLASKGLARGTSSSPIVPIRALPKLGNRATTDDKDYDGLSDPIDADDDGDGTLDNYDSDESTTASATSFNLFSNLKLSIDQSINFQTTGLSTTQIDTAMQSVQTLAIQVAGSGSSAVELDCGSLGYCSSGGTGRTVVGFNNFPGTAGGTYDSDSDGLGTITSGPTGDFQLQTGAKSSTISAGDVLMERVTTSGVETIIPGMLNFVFASNPAIKSVKVNSDTAQNVDYTVTPKLGSSSNCISVPNSGTVALTLVGYRPQRPGVSTAGEGAYVDIGGSLVTIDIPNGASVSGTGGSGPGNCRAASYTPASGETNLVADANGLKDNFADTDTSASNTYSFVIDVTDCMTNAPSGPFSWNAGEKLFVDLQFRSSQGDNAAQKICLQRLP